MSRLSEQDAAYCAAAWASGTSQKELARQFGYKTAARVCVEIMNFLHLHGSKHVTRVYGDARKALVPDALKAYQRAVVEDRKRETRAQVSRKPSREIQREIHQARYWSIFPPLSECRALPYGSTPEACYTITQYLKMGAGPIDCHAIELDHGAFTIGVPFTPNTRARRKAAYRKARTAAEPLEKFQ